MKGHYKLLLIISSINIGMFSYFKGITLLIGKKGVIFYFYSLCHMLLFSCKESLMRDFALDYKSDFVLHHVKFLFLLIILPSEGNSAVFVLIVL